MIDIARASATAVDSFPYNWTEFYGDASSLSVGVGLVYDRIRYPLFSPTARAFDTVEGLVYVLTHECDIDRSNQRHFNDMVLVCPIIPFDDFAKEYAEKFSPAAVFGFLPALAGDTVYRAFYLPPRYGSELDRGGILYLNQICSTHIDEFQSAEATAVCALSEYGQNILDQKIKNHLLRPKDETLPRTR